MKQLEQPSWFSLGDLDLATHLTRTAMLRAGKTLSEATAELAAKFGIRARVLPMSDDRVSTMLETTKGTLSFQEYFVRERHQVEVRAVSFECAEQARPAPGVIESIGRADAVVFAPSNPVTSIGPMLAVPGVRDALRRTPALVIAVSPIVGGTAVSGPAGELMQMMGWPSTSAGVAKAYEDFLDVLVADETELPAISRQPSTFSSQQSAVSNHKSDSRSTQILYTNTIMRSMKDKRELAVFILDSCAISESTKA
jgi:LPPG:FO 2-phospho-L-lactate transferase